MLFSAQERLDFSVFCIFLFFLIVQKQEKNDIVRSDQVSHFHLFFGFQQKIEKSSNLKMQILGFRAGWRCNFFWAGSPLVCVPKNIIWCPSLIDLRLKKILENSKLITFTSKKQKKVKVTNLIATYNKSISFSIKGKKKKKKRKKKNIKTKK